MTNRATILFGMLSILAVPGAANAQEGGVAESGMQQGHAQISTRADVAMTLSTMEGTNASRLTAITPELSGKMAAVRQCYSRVTSARPTVTGALSISVVAPPSVARVDVSVTDDHVNDAELLRCTTRAFETLRVAAANRPMGVVVHLTFSNSAARGVEAVQTHRAEQTSVEVVGTGNTASVRGRIPTGEVSFEARGPSTETELRSLGTFVLDHIAVLLDCRRRAGRRGASPEGHFTMELDTHQGRVSRVAVPTTTFTRADVSQCVMRAVRGLRPPADLAVEGAQVEVTFGPAAP